MLYAAQSMAIGTVMVRWVSKHSDPIMATGWVLCVLSWSVKLVAVVWDLGGNLFAMGYLSTHLYLVSRVT